MAITLKMFGNKIDTKAYIEQFGVNSNKATTGHKLQGVSLKNVIGYMLFYHR